MRTSTELIKQDFWKIEQLAQEIDRGSPIATQEFLFYILSTFTRAHDYIRSPYELNFSRVQRARALPPDRVDTLEKAEKEFGNISSMSYVPEQFLKYVAAGRCNLAEEAVFYCSNENAVPIFEVRPALGSYVVVANYRHKMNKTITFHAPVIGIKQIIQQLEKRDQMDNLLPIIKEDPLLKRNEPNLVLIDDLFSEWFTRPSKNYLYRLTTTLYRLIVSTYGSVDGKIRMDGLVYPSFASELTGVNIAFESKFVDEHLKFSSATLYQLEKVEGSYMYLRCLKEVRPNDVDAAGNITWKDSRSTGALFDFGPNTPTMAIPDYDVDELELNY